jgi:hypothetical protein
MVIIVEKEEKKRGMSNFFPVLQPRTYLLSSGRNTVVLG